jgi:hypothetical protein
MRSAAAACACGVGCAAAAARACPGTSIPAQLGALMTSDAAETVQRQSEVGQT